VQGVLEIVTEFYSKVWLMVNLQTISIPPPEYFADDSVIYKPMHTEKDHQLMQEDLDTLVGWSDTWQMEFNVSKCPIMQATNKKSKTDFPYKMKGETLQKAYHQPYLRLSAMSLMNTRNNVGPSTVPWGTPYVTWEHLEASPSTTTLWILLLRNASIHILISLYHKLWNT
jgi:hypothetical protein